MSVENVSERLFREFCDRVGLRSERIPTKENQKSPDFDLYPNFRSQTERIVTEIKELQPNSRDLELYEQLRQTGSVCASSDTVKRVLGTILPKARKQLKARAAGILPTMLVLFDNGIFSRIGSDDIKDLMYGYEAVTVFRSPTGQETIRPSRSTPIDRVAREDKNTSISCIAVLSPDGDFLSVFHNIYASVPLNPDLLRYDSINHFAIPDDTLAWPQWCEV